MVVVVLMTLTGLASAGETGPVIDLPERDRAEIDKLLGRGVVGQAVMAPTIVDPARYLGLEAGPKTFRVVDGSEVVKIERQQFTLLKQQPGLVIWRYDQGGGEVGFLGMQQDGSFVMTGIQDKQDEALTRYSPPEPILLKGLVPGEEKTVKMGVNVYDLNNPEKLIHQGAVAILYRYMGAYRIAVPAGTFDAVLLKSTFNGKIGPAKVNDTQYRFFVADVGIVVTAELRDVSALVFYHTRNQLVRVLLSLSGQ